MAQHTKGMIAFGLSSGGKRPGLFGFDPFVREASDQIQGSPPIANKMFGVCCGLVNLCFQYNLLFNGGAQSILSLFGFTSPWDTEENGRHFNQQKRLLFSLLIANEVQAQIGSCFIFFHRAWGALDVSVFTFIFVRGFFFTVYSLAIYVGGGVDQLIPARWAQWALLAMWMLAMVLERLADAELADFVKRKVRAKAAEASEASEATQADAKRDLEAIDLQVEIGASHQSALQEAATKAAQEQPTPGSGRICREGLWAWMRHPNYFFFCWHWLLLAPFTGSWIAIAYFLVANHGWIIFQGIPALESHMLQKYGEEYAEYKKNVPALYPFWLCGR